MVYEVDSIEMQNYIGKSEPHYLLKNAKFDNININETRPATPAEIEAHKLGFHVGDEVYIPEKRVIKSFEIRNITKELMCWFTNRMWTPADEITKQKPSNLMLGEYPVTISDGFVNCKNGVINAVSWLDYVELINISYSIGKPISFDAFIFFPENINISTYFDGKLCKIGCIENATWEQIKAITKAVKKLNKI